MIKHRKGKLAISGKLEYRRWVKEIKAKVHQAQLKAAISVNTELINLYWELGRMIVQKQMEAKWGDKFVEELSKDLLAEFPAMKGFSRTNLLYIRKWYLFYNNLSEIVPQLVGQLPQSPKSRGKTRSRKSKSPLRAIVPQLVGQIPWGHNREIVTHCKDLQEASFYITETIKHHWSRNVLVLQMESNLYKRQGKAITNFEYTLPHYQSDLATETLKSPYTFDFLGLEDKVQERKLEKALIENVKDFMLALGKGYAYVGNQYNLTVESDDFFLDLLFYNYHLHCFVVIELKVGPFKPEYAGKLTFYINTIDAQVKSREHRPTIGILLCRTPNKTVVEYSLRGLGKPVGVADYTLSKALPESLKDELPTVKELQQQLQCVELGTPELMSKKDMKALPGHLRRKK